MKTYLRHPELMLLCFLWLSGSLHACQNTRTEVAGIPVNYDESKVSTYTLPDPLVLQNGKRVNSPKAWLDKRRKEILALFESEQFGKSPDRNQNRFTSSWEKKDWKLLHGPQQVPRY